MTCKAAEAATQPKAQLTTNRGEDEPVRVEQLNCAVMRPVGIRPLVAHVFLVDPEDGSGLTLVDTGFGTEDLAEPTHRLGLARHMLRPDRDPEHTAAHQLTARGHCAEDVAHIVLTHLDLDHVGGLSDFPDAQVHTTAAEHEAALVDLRPRDKTRYRPVQFNHEPHFVLHPGRGDRWRGNLTGHEVVPGVTLVPLPGHSRGHGAVAVQTKDGLLVHAGDASFDGSSFADHSPSGKPLKPLRSLRLFEQIAAHDRSAIAANHAALRFLNAEPDVTVVNAHDPRLLPPGIRPE